MRHHAQIALATAFAALVAVVAPSPVSAQPATRFIEQRHQQVNRILRQPATNDAARQRRSQEVHQVLGGLLDYQALSQGALGSHWDERSEEERAQFVGLLEQLVRRQYERNLERILDYDISYGDEERADGRSVVHTTARSRTNRRQPPVEITYTVVRSGRTWRVVDVDTDGVSMVANYRRQFSRIIRRNGWSALIERMESRLNSGQQAAATPPAGGNGNP